MALSAVALSSYMPLRAPNNVHGRLLASVSSGRELPRRTAVVRCQMKPEKPASPSPASMRAPKELILSVSTKFSDVLAFSGPAPERINGRLAMLGFVAAVAVEAAKGDDLFAQLANGGFPWFIGTTVLFSVASLVPLFKGDSVQSKTDGVMNEYAELWNGRLAMLGLVALAFTEYFKGGPLV